MDTVKYGTFDAMGKNQISFTLKEEQASKLRKAAENENISLSAYCRQIVLNNIKSEDEQGKMYNLMRRAVGDEIRAFNKQRRDSENKSGPKT